MHVCTYALTNEVSFFFFFLLNLIFLQYVVVVVVIDVENHLQPQPSQNASIWHEIKSNEMWSKATIDFGLKKTSWPSDDNP